MKNLKSQLLLAFLFLLFVNAKAGDYHVRFAFMGNSITIGSGLGNAPVECYPSQIQLLLNQKYGDTCLVENFAVSGRTMLKKGDFPLWNEPQFQQSLDYAPDIVFIMLGTNDTKPYNWDDYGDEFIADYQSMIDTFKVRNPRCKFILAYPPPAFAVNYDIRNTVIVDGVLPALDSLLLMNEAESIDFYHPLLDSAYLFPDAIHPNAAGAKVLAQMAFNKIVETDIVHQVESGYTYVTGISSSSAIIAQNGEVTISWTSRSADSVYFNGELVDVEGSTVFIVAENTTFTVRAVGSKNSDEKTFFQETYVPELVKLKAERKPLKIAVGDSSFVTISFFDQYNKEIKEREYDLKWEFNEGEGNLVNETFNSITLVGTNPGTVKLQASVGDLIVEVRINVVEKTGIDLADQRGLFVFPNPANEQLFIRGIDVKVINYRLVNGSGEIILNDQTKQNQIQLNGVSPGIYYLEINCDRTRFVRKVIIN
ncbi:MAG: GDSL-type esterase/lipase family protein [Prolixibacteraceae bacterium]